MARYAIRGLDMAADTVDQMVQFMVVAQKNDVDVRFTSARGPNGYPVASLYSPSLYDISAVLRHYCDGDERATDDLIGMVERVEDFERVDD